MESQIKSKKRTIVHKKSKLSDCLCKTETVRSGIHTKRIIATRYRGKIF